MAYIDILTLDEAKNHLKIDSDLTDDDGAITRMISSAFRYIERETNILVYQRSETYKMVDGCVTVYDSPIDSVDVPTDYDADDTIEKTTYNIYNYGSDTTDLTLTVGYLLPTDVPEDLIYVALEIIDLMYYEEETGKSFKKDLSELSKDIIFSNKRFIL